MYLVSPKDFKAFLDSLNLAPQIVPTPKHLPCLIEFERNNILYAKIETLSFPEAKSVIRFGKSLSPYIKNKYWIRGKEWVKDTKGAPIQKLVI